MLPRRRAAYAADMVKVTDRLNALLATTTFEHTETPHTVVGRTLWFEGYDQERHKPA